MSALCRTAPKARVRRPENQAKCLPAGCGAPSAPGEVSCSPDLKVATVYVMPLMGSVPVEGAIAALARNKAELRHRVAAELTLKYAPDLRFRPDETFDRLDETRRLFSDPAVQRDLEKPETDEEA